MLSDQYSDRTIASDVRDNELLIQGLQDGTYQMIILPYFQEMEGVESRQYLSGSSGLYFRDLNGETMLLRSKIGFWHKLHIEKMPDTHFLIQEDVSAFDELVKASALPSFTSDLVIQREGEVPNRVKVPILDEEANVTYFLYFHKKDTKMFDWLLRRFPSVKGTESL